MRFLLLPFAFLYSFIVTIRNLGYTTGVLKSHAFDFPVIVVGNLRVGGTGKTPTIEYLIRLLHNHYKIAVLSRGYGRKTKGFILANEHSDAKSIGDEPRQIKQKFQAINVAVDANRVSGIQKLRTLIPSLDVVLLDDAMQHRKVRAGLNIMLTAHDRFYKDDFILPVGRLREPRASSDRAQIIVVTKCPSSMSKDEQRSIETRIAPKPYQTVCFAYEGYGNVSSVFGEEQFDIEALAGKRIVLVTGIANADKFKSFLTQKNEVVEHLDFGDHHWYSDKDIDHIVATSKRHHSSDTLVITTEKDVQRFLAFSSNESFISLPIFYIPIEVRFHDKSGEFFDQIIHEYVKSYQ